MQEKLVFGQIPSAQPPKAVCSFYVMVIERDGLIKSAPCQEKPMINGWCLRHQHAQTGMDLGAKLGYPEIKIPLGVTIHDEPCYIILGQGRVFWLAYFERGTDPGLKTVMNYIEKLK